ncbi:hypothetical protein BJ170DRAFT_406890 [Xylariales sp. AK1849]|nr:hypothetical protein BJ170DRAFT_406890 [Xylariales sp. AK1849]
MMSKRSMHASNVKQSRARPVAPGIRQAGLDGHHGHFPVHPYHTFGPICANGFNGVAFVLHPWAFGPRINFQDGMTEDRVTGADKAHTKGTTKVRPAATVVLKSDTRAANHLGEQKLQQAARQLRDQVTNSENLYKEFHKSFKDEVKELQDYGDDIHMRLWKAKVASNRKHETNLGEEDEQLRYQRNKLNTCLGNLNDAAAVLAAAQSSRHRGGHDSRHLQLEKIRLAGDRVDRLASKTLSSEAACKDLIIELNELYSLLKPENEGAKVLFKFTTIEESSASQPDETEDVQGANATEEDDVGDQDDEPQDAANGNRGW